MNRTTAVIAIVTDPQQAAQALAAGADALEPDGPGVREAVAASHPAATLSPPGSPGAVDCDAAARVLPAGPGRQDGPGPGLAAIVATAAIATWQGAAAVRTREVTAVRRAVDMTAAIRGDRPPALTLRALA